MSRVIVIAGTGDARKLIEKLIGNNIKVTATVATGFGKEMLADLPGAEIIEGRLSGKEMEALLLSNKIGCLVDASHPYAKEVSVNAIEACKKAGTKYIRFERPESLESAHNVIFASSFDEAAKRASEMEGKVFLTVGSKNLEVFKEKISIDRIVARVLPDSGVLKRCEELGLNAKNIIAMMGPFTEGMNIEMLRQCGAGVLVTKDSGKEGGAPEKLSAAGKLGIPVIIVGRPEVQYGTKLQSIDDVLTKVKICLTESDD